jgi:hypothetical protein
MVEMTLEQRDRIGNFADCAEFAAKSDDIAELKEALTSMCSDLNVLFLELEGDL